jgi:hypothetical protein
MRIYLKKASYLTSLFYFSVPPQGVQIQRPLQPFTAGREYFVACKVWGSNPPARIEWFRGTSPNHGLRPLKAHNQTVTEGGNVTISWLLYVPRPSHHHQTLICRGSNEELMTANSHTVEDYQRMEIFCKYFHFVSRTPFSRADDTNGIVQQS